MENKILELLLDMQKEIREVNNKLDRIENKMDDKFETLELLSENNSSELSKLKIQISKLENRVKEINMQSLEQKLFSCIDL
ncbi:Uncharacterised protein [[Clostridium] sordellii]|uniref:Uncharacterized protein n=1 Tax=Paraclostridium sordellii TaxID=1505 RepID=A0A0C7LAD6_PARSO|nr:hypothetical protein [Paeniclostridium sordellii]CEP38314.1 Uncharacterised protein [[Clostridium] sordellii] [Paeniclostridium sordellii]CEP41392.1 Uncharacterised protein [[Clostridium] sordellii] [Paeniclostridium sordellii]